MEKEFRGEIKGELERTRVWRAWDAKTAAQHWVGCGSRGRGCGPQGVCDLPHVSEDSAVQADLQVLHEVPD